MHETQLPYVKAYIDQSQEKKEYWEIVGWAFDTEKNKPFEQIRLVLGNDEQDESHIYTLKTFFSRIDVAASYPAKQITNCGIHLVFEKPNDIDHCFLQVQHDQKWRTFQQLNLKVKDVEKIEKKQDIIAITKPAHITVSNDKPTVVVIDNFYNDPDAVREYAMSCDFYETEYHKGQRTLTRTIFEGTKAHFEQVLGKKITKRDYGTNGVFQYCTAINPLVIHTDRQNYAAMIFLSPDAPPSCGTTFYRHCESKIRKYCETENIEIDIFKNNFYDKTPFEKMDVVGNVYNRLRIFDSHNIHAASEYFGDTMENSRLFQIFFFDVE